MVSVKKLFASAALVAALALTLGAKPAQALPLDLTLDPLEILYDGTNFSALGGWGGFTVLSWVDDLGVLGGPVIGTASISWDGDSGVIDVFDVDNGVQLLLADLINFTAYTMSGGGASWGGIAAVRSSTLAFTPQVRFAIGSSDYVSVSGTGTGSGAADIASVPEPATLALTLAGFGLAAVRARRRRA
jgi:hypothetical protein